MVLGVTTGLVMAFLAIDLWRANGRLVVGDEVAGHIHAPDPVLGWRLKPDSACRHVRPGDFDVAYTIDSDGYRTGRPAAEDEPTITFYGDSYTFGHGVEDNATFENVMADRYLAPQVGVRNAGVNGYGLTQMYARFLEDVDGLRPGDVVVFSPTASDIERSVQDFVFPYACAFARGEERIRVTHFPVFSNGGIEGIELRRTAWNRIKLLALMAPSTRGLWQGIHRAFVSDTTADAVAMVGCARKAAECQGARFALVFLPRVSECAKGQYDRDLSRFAFEDIMSEFPSDKAELAALRFDSDPHWNAAGHAVAARAVTKAMVACGALDAAHLIADLDE
ncbi:MAG TPA: hypothetical protein PLO37_06905 [Candidatus Hydrogenedentes bacterium]|nr:hypothetical protein [Candidatus Hydrogenedentota bacterium]HPG66560.1 hypothetical protein [Candidatus Hydrogenedentota bacterium]